MPARMIADRSIKYVRMSRKDDDGYIDLQVSENFGGKTQNLITSVFYHGANIHVLCTPMHDELGIS